MIVGILTIHAAINYGSVLQAFALQKYLQMNNPQDDFQIIDYCPSIIMDQYSLALSKNIETPKSFIKYILSYKDRKNRGLAFEQFIKSKMKLSPRKYTSDDDLRRDEKRWDSFLLGSDQIWNPEIVGNSDIFMLGFCKDEFCGSFASSFGKLKISDEYLKKLSNELFSEQQLKDSTIGKYPLKRYGTVEGRKSCSAFHPHDHRKTDRPA